jgi:hypothetical protein
MRIPRPTACAALYAASLLALLESHLGHGWGFVDLAVYRKGAEATMHGAHLYALRFPGALAFTYPPIAALLFTTLTVPSIAVAELAVTAASVVLVPAMLYFALRLEPAVCRLPPQRALRLALLVSPISWSHHWTLAVSALLLFALSAWRRRSRAGLAAAGAVVFVACSHMIWWVPVNRPAHSELHLDPLQLVYSDAYVLIGLCALALAGGVALRERSSTGESASGAMR